MQIRSYGLAVMFVFIFCACSPKDEQSDITFLVAGKTSNYRQVGSKPPYLLNYHFFAEIFPKKGGQVTAASLQVAGNKKPEITFTDLGYVLEAHGGRYPTEAMLNAEYPNGRYRFAYHSPSTGSVSQWVMLGESANRRLRLPDPPQILLSQEGVPVEPDAINPDLDMTVSWSKFADGAADPNDIMDDLIFVIMGDCLGERIAHSGRPFENTPYLTYQDSQFVIPASAFAAGNIYQLQVEHAVLGTSIEHGVPGFATFATTTFLDINTLAGEGVRAGGCQEIKKKFDAGQTDR